MDTFQKIYKALVVMLVLSIGVLCLNDLGIIDLSTKMTSEGADTTGSIVLAIAIVFVIMSFIFSRAANVIANKNNRVVGYIAVFISLIVLLLLAIVLIMGIETILKYIKYILILLKIVILVTLIVLVFEVPQANTGHGLFQKITAGIITITFIFAFFINGNNKIDLSSIETVNIDSSMEGITEEEEKKNTTNDKIQTVLTYLSLGCFLLNPMLRVYYLDQDYSEEHEIENIIKDASENVGVGVGNNPNPNAVVSDTYKKPTIPDKPKEVPKPTTVVQPVEEIHEKVVNPNFKPSDLPDAIIPTISSENEMTEMPTIQEEPSVADNSQPIVNLEQAPTNEFVPPSIDNSQNIDTQGPTLLEQMQQPIIETQPVNNVPFQNELQPNLDNSQSVTPLEQVQQPVDVQTQPIDNAPVQNEFIQPTIDNNQSVTPIDQVQQPVDIQPQPMLNLEQIVQTETPSVDNNQNMNVQSATPLDQVQQPVDVQNQPVNNAPMPNEFVQPSIDNNQNVQVSTPLDQVQQPPTN